MSFNKRDEKNYYYPREGTSTKMLKNDYYFSKNKRYMSGGDNNNNNMNCSNAEFEEKGLELFLKNADNITKEANKMKMSLIEPYEHEIYDIYDIIFKFIKENKRKVYGGFALNYLLKDKDPTAGIYGDEETPDVDFYSPDPLRDLVKLCNTIYQKGYKDVVGREAIHKETYTLRVKDLSFCDISYVPRNIYNKMPFREMKNIYITGPEFMVIDYYRILTDIILTSFRIEKTVKRLHLLQKYYPAPCIKKPLIILRPIFKSETGDEAKYEKSLSIIQKFATNNKETILIGFYAYNQFLHESGILKNVSNTNTFRYINVPYYEIIATDYIKNSLELIDILKKEFPNQDDIHTIEYYPFFQFWGHSVCIYYKTTLIAKIYNNNKKCIPYRVVPAYTFSNKINTETTDNKIYIASFPMTTLYILITVIKARVDDNEYSKDIKTLCYTMLSHMRECRKYYFNTMNKTLLDDTIFKEYVIQCLGKPITPQYEKQLLIESRKRQNKRYKFSYDPSENVREDYNYVFANSSGNPINNVRNLKLQKDVNVIDNMSDGESDFIDEDLEDDDPNLTTSLV